jgi:hypothetical protein
MSLDTQSRTGSGGGSDRPRWTAVAAPPERDADRGSFCLADAEHRRSMRAHALPGNPKIVVIRQAVTEVPAMITVVARGSTSPLWSR